jgi:hypothetical protein
MMVLFQYLHFLRIKGIDLHNLAVKKQVHSCSYLLIIFIKLLVNIPVVLLLHQKARGSPFIINMTSWLSTQVVVT